HRARNPARFGGVAVLRIQGHGADAALVAGPRVSDDQGGQMSISKQCRRCGEVKASDSFSKATRSPDGLHAHCKRCRSIRNAAAQRSERGNDATYIWPRPLTERLCDLRLREWHYPATAGQLTWRV